MLNFWPPITRIVKKESKFLETKSTLWVNPTLFFFIEFLAWCYGSKKKKKKEGIDAMGV